jgi:osmoprotectant transport system permease protein
MISILLEERASATVDRRFDLGGTLLCFEALRAGEISVYPEYTGTGLAAILEEDPPREPLAAWLRVRRRFAEAFDLVWLEPFGFENTYALAVRPEDARRLGLRTLSDLARRSKDLALGASAEFLRRPDGLAAVEERYGLAFGDVRSLSHELAYEALAERRIDVIDAYTTDAELARWGAVCLEDDRRAFPPYHAAPLARRDLLDRWPRVRTALESVAGKIDADSMRLANAAVLAGESPSTVARRFLEREGLLGPRPPGEPVAARGSWKRFLARESVDLARWTLEHLVLSGLAVVAAIAAGVPSGIWVARRPRAASALLSLLGVIETIPSLALLGLLLPVLGIGFAPAVVALFLYALLPIVRGTVVGLRSIDPLVLETADGLGLTAGQRLRAIELPLAFEGILAGVRTSAVIAVGTATLAAFIGAGGLGEPIFTGLKLARTSLILEGAIPAAVLALAVDGGLAWIERRVHGR